MYKGHQLEIHQHQMEAVEVSEIKEKENGLTDLFFTF
jgi:hypothetical protein